MARLELTDEVKSLLADKGYDPVFGARPLKRVIQQKLQNALATEILKGRLSAGHAIKIDFSDGDFQFQQPINENSQVSSEAAT